MVKSNLNIKSYSPSTFKPSAFKYSSYSPPPIVFYALLFLVIASVGVGIYSVVEISQIKKTITPETIKVDDFLKKVTAHAELSAYKTTPPVNVVQINSANLPQLQSQIQGLNVNYIGKFLVQYQDKLVLYDFAADKIEGIINLQQQPQLPQDLLAKLYSHPETKNLQGVNPAGGVLDTNSLTTLKQQFPDVYKDAKEGDVLLRFPTALVIYDYGKDKIVSAVPLQEQAQQK